MSSESPSAHAASLPPPVPHTIGDDARRLLAEPARQSPLALVFIAGRFIRRLGLSALAALFIFVANGGLALGSWLLAGAVAAVLLVVSALNWWRFTFVVSGDEIVATRGIVSIERLVIPLDRVQSVAINQRFMHRLVGLVSAAVDTAGSAGVELEIDAIDRARAEALQRVAADVRAERPPRVVPTVPAPVVERLMLRRSLGELVVIGATRVPWAGLVALVPLFAIADELNLLGDEQIERLADRTGDLGVGSFTAAIVAAIGGVFALTLIGLLLQVIRTIVADWDLSLYRSPGGGLRRTAGLLSTTSRASTVRRIQTITTDDSPAQRWLGITHLRLRAFGDNDISLPGSSPAEVAELRLLVFGAVEPPAHDRMISRWWVFRATRNTTVVVSAVVIALWFAIGWWALAGFCSIPIRWGAAHRSWRLRRWGLADGRLAESREFIARHTAEVPFFKAQTVTVTRSRFERRRGLATVTVRTADGDLTVPMIPHADAFAVRDQVLHAVESDRRRAL